MKLTKELLLLLLFFVIDAEKDRGGEDIRVDLSGTGFTVEEVFNMGKKWAGEKDSLRLLVTGKTGVGKSTLVNGLLGEKVAEAKRSFNSVTKKTTGYHDKIGGVDVIVFDTPGLFDPKMEDDAIFADIKTKTEENIDLLLYCIKMTETRISKDHIKAIQRVTNELGNSVWEKGLFVLTFANHITEDTMPEDNEEMKLEDYFQVRLTEMKEHLHRVMIEEIGISPEVANEIPVVPAGGKRPKLPDREHWISELWIQAFRRLDFPAMMAFLVMSQGRIIDSSDEIFEGSPEKQPLIVNHMSEDDHVIDPEWYPVIGNLAGYTVGFALGSLIYPGFGTAMGATLGSAGGEALGNVFKEYMTHKKTDQCEPPQTLRTAAEKVFMPSIMKALNKKLKMA